MFELNKFLDSLFLNSSSYPNVDLCNPEILSAQFENIRKFKIRQSRVYLCLFFIVFVFLSLNIIAQYFSIDAKTNTFGLFAFVPLLIITICLIYSMRNYKCPNCGTIPAGTGMSVGTGVSYSKGIHPFPQRCTCCGSYLSQRSLQRDLVDMKKIA